MKTWGYVLVSVGIIYLFYAFNMDVSVSSPSTYIPGYGSFGGQKVANLDLMARRQNHLIVAALITLIGAAMAIFGKDDTTSDEKSSEPITPPKTPQVYSGDRDLGDDKYRLWLAGEYGIERNAVFDRFVLSDRTFESLDAALLEAHAMEQQRLEEVAAAEKAKAEAIAQAEEEQRIRNEQVEADWRDFQRKFIIGSLIIVIFLVAGHFVMRETPEEREIRIAKEEAERVKKIEELSARFGVQLPEDAANVTVEAKEAGNSYLCDGISKGAILEFETESSEQEVQKLFAESLGKGRQKYSSTIGYDWTWDNDGILYDLTMLEYGEKVDVNLCMTDNS